MPKLSIRLSTIASLVPSGARVCDIGTDHGYLAIQLIRSGKATKVIATDIGEKPLHNAAKNLEISGVSSVELRLCDGLSGISPSETDTIIIAGMGGEVISGILERGEEISQRKDISIILQPTTSPEALRRFLCDNGYEIIKEIPISENNKLYSVMLVIFTGKKAEYNPSFYYIGKVTPETESGLLYIKKQEKRCSQCIDALKTIPEKQAEFSEYKSAFDGIKNMLEKFGVN